MDFTKISPIVIETIDLLSVLCNPKTKGTVITTILKTADKQLLTAIGEVIINCKISSIPKSVKNIFTVKRGRAKKLLTLRKHWKKLRGPMSNIVRQIQHGARTNGSRITERNGAEKTENTNK